MATAKPSSSLTNSQSDISKGYALKAISAAYAALKGMEANKALVPYVLDHAIQEQIDSLKADDPKNSSVNVSYSTSKSKGRKLTRYERISAIETDLSAVVRALKDAGNDPEKAKKLGLVGK